MKIRKVANRTRVLLAFIFIAIVIAGWIGIELFSSAERQRLFGEWSSRGVIVSTQDSELADQLKASLPFVSGIVDFLFSKRYMVTDPTGLLSDTDVCRLCRYEACEDLTLRHPKISMKGVSCLVKSKSIKLLVLQGQQVTDEWLLQVKKMPQLEHLALRECRISSQCLSELSSMTSLETLVLADSLANRDFISEVRKIPSISHLVIECPSINESDLIELKDIPKMSHLTLSGMKLTDLGVDTLLSLKNLQAIALIDAHLTSENETKLKTARSNLTVTIYSR